MQKKTMIIISLISAVLSLIYVILNYFGLIRYISLYLFPVEGYSKNYKNLDKISDYRTVISLTTTPEQMKNLTPTIKSLLDQTVKVNLISVIVPYGNKYKLPSKLKDSVSIFRCGTDNGSLNCLLPAILREGESTTRIITLGAGKIYGKDFIEILLNSSDKNPNTIIYENNKDYINLMNGVVFCTSFFDEKILDVPNNIEPNEWVNKYFKSFPKEKINYSENYKSM
jgi:hypothetical protein